MHDVHNDEERSNSDHENSDKEIENSDWENSDEEIPANIRNVMFYYKL